ncbi:MAG: hypothetical protein K8U57_31590 [Planctomycetes bacterium]|nr:hypothetical protein [Planctomycetota bacterium]
MKALNRPTPTTTTLTPASDGSIVDVGLLVNDIGELSPERIWRVYTEWLCGWRVPRIAKFYGLSDSFALWLTRGWERGTVARPSPEIGGIRRSAAVSA